MYIVHFAIFLFRKEDKMFIFRASKTVNGEKIYAKDYGKRAFKIWIPDNSESVYKSKDKKDKKDSKQ